MQVMQRITYLKVPLTLFWKKATKYKTIKQVFKFSKVSNKSLKNGHRSAMYVFFPRYPSRSFPRIVSLGYLDLPSY